MARCRVGTCILLRGTEAGPTAWDDASCVVKATAPAAPALMTARISKTHRLLLEGFIHGPTLTQQTKRVAVPRNGALARRDAAALRRAHPPDPATAQPCTSGPAMSQAMAPQRSLARSPVPASGLAARRVACVQGRVQSECVRVQQPPHGGANSIFAHARARMRACAC